MRASRHHPRTIQLDLFHPARREAQWARLPAQVRERTKLLLTKLLRDHAEEAPSGGAEEVRGDE